jgi:hypothetical protein
LGLTSVGTSLPRRRSRRGLPRSTSKWPTFQAVITHATLNRCAYQFEIEVRVSLE